MCAKQQKSRSSKNSKKWDRRSTIQLKNFKEEEFFEEDQARDLLDDENEIETQTTDAGAADTETAAE